MIRDSLITPQPELPEQSAIQVYDGFRLEECYRMRHAYFVRERRWVTENATNPGIEQDRYDAHCLHLACYDAHGLAAYIRALPHYPRVGFMFDHEFKMLMEGGQDAQLPRERALELSRLVVRPGLPLCLARDAPHPVEEVLRLLYGLSIHQGYDRYYIVVEQAWLPLFSRRFGLPFKVQGRPKTFSDGTRTVLASATLEELKDGMQRHSLERYRWYLELEVKSANSGLK